jgi:hypothetical protein
MRSSSASPCVPPPRRFAFQRGEEGARNLGVAVLVDVFHEPSSSLPRQSGSVTRRMAVGLLGGAIPAVAAAQPQ